MSHCVLGSKVMNHRQSVLLNCCFLQYLYLRTVIFTVREYVSWVVIQRKFEDHGEHACKSLITTIDAINW